MKTPKLMSFLLIPLIFAAGLLASWHDTGSASGDGVTTLSMAGVGRTMEIARVQIRNNKLEIELYSLAPETQLGLAPVLVSAHGEQQGKFFESREKTVVVFSPVPPNLVGAMMRLPLVTYRIDATTSQAISKGAFAGPDGESYSITETVVDSEQGVVSLRYTPETPHAPLVSKASIVGSHEAFRAGYYLAGFTATTHQLMQGEIVFPIDALPLIDSGQVALQITQFRGITGDMIMLEGAD